MRWTITEKDDPCCHLFHGPVSYISSPRLIPFALSTYISILRGINVGGHRQIQMPALTALYRELGLLKPTSYIQSGNVVFDTRRRFSAAKLGTRLEQAILEKFGFEVKVLVLTVEEMRRALAANPFLKLKGIHPEKLYVTFLATEPVIEGWEDIAAKKGSQDLFAVIGRQVYLYLPAGYGKALLNNHFFELRFGVTATTRNWRTANMLMEMAASR